MGGESILKKIKVLIILENLGSIISVIWDCVL